MAELKPDTRVAIYGLVSTRDKRQEVENQLAQLREFTSAIRANAATACNNVTCPVAGEITIRHPQAGENNNLPATRDAVDNRQCSDLLERRL
jgi:predicted site-specific integrase-resolvase